MKVGLLRRVTGVPLFSERLTFLGALVLLDRLINARRAVISISQCETMNDLTGAINVLGLTIHAHAGAGRTPWQYAGAITIHRL